MDIQGSINTEQLDNIIYGRVEPHLYAFTTGTVPNYLKVGDTFRPVEIRLNEWREHFKDLNKEDSWVAKTESGKYFRDYAVHYYLETIEDFHRLQKGELEVPYYSKEFFKDATTHDVQKAIKDINDKSEQVGSPYQFYTEDRLHVEEHYARVEDYDPRPNQQKTIERFKSAVEQGRKNLLMYAVMRFGKSFTSMCCATAMNANIVLVVSAKADVIGEWKKTVESHIRFKKYRFFSSENLLADKEIISKTIKEGNGAVIFLTLQDLMGDDIKSKHQDLFNQNIDLLIVDETHFGARANVYGKILENSGLTKKQIEKETSNSDDSLDQLDKGLENIKSLNVNVKLHLSGTPYRILMGSEFTKDDIIAFYQFTDIIDDKEQWDKEYLETVKEGTQKQYEEWDNPYYGFPQMVRFAFSPNASSRQLIENLKQQGKTAALNELFKPASIAKDSNGRHKKFIHEQEVLELLQVIDGSKEDNNLLGFLNYEKLKEGKMCRHIVCVLPFCASCDAMESLISRHKSIFKNLNDYEIINISGVDNKQPKIAEVKERISRYEKEGKKTISLTVNKMLTGTTVPEWDTMLFMKDVSSPQEYDQATFRLQNQYVVNYQDEEGGVIKYNMKPQTLLVDFDINRMFIMQEQKSMIYNVNTKEKGNDELEERVKRELEISPIIMINKNKLVEATPANIMDAVRQYSANRTVMDEALDVPVDFKILDDPNIQRMLDNISPIDEKKGIDIKPTEGDGDDFDIPDGDDDNDNTDGDDDTSSPSGDTNSKKTESEEDNLGKKLATYFSQILFFSLLTDNDVRSLNDIIFAITSNEDNKRIASNIGLQVNALKYLAYKLNPFILSKLDYKIQNVNDLVRDESKKPIERVELALKKFGRLSDSEVVTPTETVHNVIDMLPEEAISETAKILDIASKEGEFACGLYKKFGEKVKNNIISLPTSSLTYEFTRKVYRLLDMPIENVIDSFTSYDIIETDNIYYSTLQSMNINIIVGNPPYQDMGGSGGSNDAPIFQKFSMAAFGLNPRYSSLIIPARWFAAGRENLLKDFRDYMLTSGKISKLITYTNSADVFGSVEIKGGVCYYLYDSNFNKKKKCEYTLIEKDGTTIKEPRFLDDFDILIRDPRLSAIVKKVNEQRKIDKDGTVESLISNDTPFGIPSNPKTSKKNPFNVSPTKKGAFDTPLYHIEDGVRKVEFVKRTDIRKNAQDIDKVKMFIPGAGGSGNDSIVLGKPEIAPAGAVCSQSYLYANFKTEDEAKNFVSYLKTKFFRVLVSAKKITQAANNKVYQFVPLLSLSKAWTDEELYAKYHLEEDEIKYIESMIRDL